MQKKPGNETRTIWFRVLLIVSALLFLMAFALTMYGVFTGNLLGDSDVGPGNYYYTDVPDFERRFFQTPFLGFQQPVLAAAFFIGWALFMFWVWSFVEKKYQEKKYQEENPK